MGIQKKAEKENYSQIGDKKSQDQESTGSRIDQTGILIDKKIPSETKTQGGELKDLDIDNFISKEHREKIELLKSVLFEESKNLIIPSKPEKPKFNVFRLVLSLIIIIIISFPFFFGDGSEIISGNLDTGSQLLYDSLEALQPESDVLLVVDYYPGRSAEFEVIAYPILQHIFDKQVKLSILTTKIQGLWLAHKLLDSYGDYGEVDYIPGGVFGTLSYALRDSVLVENPIGKIDNEVSLTDPVNFERILLLVDSLQGAKKWLEQVQPFHKNIPLLILSSSQEDVMLQPYLETGQLHGLLSGYHNSAIYASHLNQPLKSSNSWRAYQAGLLLMAIIILVSFIVGGIKTDKKKLHNKKDVS